jgi:hypothetical protein
LNYYWTECPKCGCQVTVQYVDERGHLLGSVRRWSTDRAINDGRKIEAGTARDAAGGFATACVCGAPVAVPAQPSAVSEGGRVPAI